MTKTKLSKTLLGVNKNQLGHITYIAPHSADLPAKTRNDGVRLRLISKSSFNSNRVEYETKQMEVNPEHRTDSKSNRSDLWKVDSLCPELARHESTGNLALAIYWRADSNLPGSSQYQVSLDSGQTWANIAYKQAQNMKREKTRDAYKVKRDSGKSWVGIRFKRYRLDRITRLAIGGEVFTSKDLVNL